MNSVRLLVLLGLLPLSACSSIDLKQIGYHALLDYQRMEQVGYANCDADCMPYETYRAEREALLEPPEAQ